MKHLIRALFLLAFLSAPVMAQQTITGTFTGTMQNGQFTGTFIGGTPAPSPTPTPNPSPTPSVLPDLIVTSLTWTPVSPVVGNGVLFTAVVKNQGVGATPPNTIVGVGFSVDGAEVTWSDNDTASLAPGASVSLTADNGPLSSSTWTATAGSHTVLAWVNDINRFPESNTSNNQLTATLVVPSPSPTPTPSPVPGSTFTPFVNAGVTYGAGGTALPKLTTGYHTYTCTSGDNTLALQNAVNASGDLQILGTSCLVNGTVNARSNQNIQCQNSTTQMTTTNGVAGGNVTAIFEYNNVSNSTISNCTFVGPNTTNPPGYPGCTTGVNNCSAKSGNSFLIFGGNGNSNVQIIDNTFTQGMDQAEVEFNGATSTGVLIDWNSFYNCGIYGPNFDSIVNSHIDHNYGFNCRIGNEPDQSNYTLAGVTVSYNYNTRNQWGTGRNNTSSGTNSCDGSEDWTGCGNLTTTQGCTSTNNVGVGYTACGNDSIQVNYTVGAPNDGKNITCSTSTGCTISPYTP